MSITSLGISQIPCLINLLCSIASRGQSSLQVPRDIVFHLLDQKWRSLRHKLVERNVASAVADARHERRSSLVPLELFCAIEGI
jgi:hypothetical protein